MGRVWETNHPCWVPDIQTEPNFPQARAAREQGLRTALAFPISFGGRVLGIVECYHRKNPQVDEGLLQLLRSIGEKLGEFSERKRIEQELRRNQELLRLVVDNAMDAVVTLDEVGNVTDWNPEAQRIFGWTRDEALERTIGDLIVPPPGRKKAADPAAKLEGVGWLKPFLKKRVELFGLRRTGQRFPIEMATTPLKAGNKTHFSAFLRDITQRKKGEEELLEAHAVLEQRVVERTAELQNEIRIRKVAEEASSRLAAIVHSSSDAILSLDLRGIVTSWNRGAQQLYGYKGNEIVGKSAQILHVPERRHEVFEAIRRIRRGKPVKAFETTRVGHDGALVDVFLQLSPIQDSSGRLCGISEVSRDVSARVRAENALRESEARLQAITDNCPSLIALKDPEGRYLHFNRAFGQLFHLELSQVRGKTDSEIFPHKQAKLYGENDWVVLKRRAPVTFDEKVQLSAGTRIGLTTRFPLFDSQGKMDAIGCVITDVTERRQLEEELLRISDREQRRIAQDLHDGLGQQLAGVCFMGDVLRRNLVSAKSPQSAQANSISKHLHAAVVQVRSLARGLYPVHEEAQGLMSALRNLTNQIESIFKVRCVFHCPRPVLLSDNNTATHLYRIAQEAISNAVRHGHARFVKVTLATVSENLQLTIRDNGTGLKTNKLRERGLGMRIMEYRAQMIGGTLKVRRNAKGGTLVECQIPPTSEPP